MTEAVVLLRVLSRALDAQADERRRRSFIAQQQKGGSVPDAEVHRWVSVWTTSYQTLRGAAQACADAANELDPPK